ncbi:MAG: hypothetical protein AB8H03_19995 [Saprospiraceae bacterium]
MEQVNIPPRISMQTIYESILAVFNFEKGFSFTVKNLLLTPGKTLSNYLFTAERTKHIKPMNFLILMITIATFLTLQLIKASHPDAMSENEINGMMEGAKINLGEDVPQKLNDAVGIFNNLVKQYYHIFQLLKIPFFALATFWIFRKKQYNYAEHLIINSYIIAMTTFLFIVASPVAFVDIKIFSVFIAGTILYMFVAYISVFEEKNWKGFLKAIGSYLLATILHTSLIILVVGGIYLSI